MASNSPQTQTTAVVPPVSIAVPAPNLVQDVIEITREIFPGSVAVESSHDPEYPHDEFTVLTVQSSGDADQLVERECQWIQRVAAVVPGLATFRLAIHPD